MKRSRLQWLTYFVMGYMLLAFFWWSVLLFTKNRDAYMAKIELQQLGMAAEGVIQTPMDFYASERYQTLMANYRRQERMIMGETVFLSLSLLVGIYIIYSGYRREVKASALQRNFLLSITHELKSPIASIRLALETLQKRGDALQPEQRSRLTMSSITESDRLNRLVEDLLLSARLESAYQFHQSPLDLGELVEKIIQEQTRLHPDASITCDKDPATPPVLADRQAMTSVVLNLIENAIKYAQGSPIVRVSVRQQGDKVALTVADQGIGIPAGERQLVFEKFYRIGSEDTRKTKGTGLGLFIVKEIIARHNGRILLSANQPQGSVFTVELPAVP
jgi:signal transduction histidine kinase